MSTYWEGYMMRSEAIHVIYDGHGLFCVHSLGLF
jgi:hypothetical protein